MRFFLLILLIAIGGLLIGGGAGSYLTYTNIMRSIASIPASPIILEAKYERENHRMVYSIHNPGTVPLEIIEKAIVFTPGEQTKEKGYVLANIPADIDLPPGTVTVVNVNLKPETEELQVGDVVVVTFTYRHPLSKDLYTVAHPFELKEKKEESK